MELSALGLNCTLKKSPDVSNTEALIKNVFAILDEKGVSTEILRPVDYNILPGVTSDEGAGDEWPQILEKIKAVDIMVLGTPIWFGHRSSVASQVIERLDGTYDERNESGQYPMYNKVAGVVVTGNEDGAHACGESICFNLMHLGFTIPPNVDTYWVGDAGPGPSYLEIGQGSEYTKRTTSWAAHNLWHFSKLLKQNPIPAEGNCFPQDVECHGG